MDRLQIQRILANWGHVMVVDEEGAEGQSMLRPGTIIATHAKATAAAPALQTSHHKLRHRTC